MTTSGTLRLSKPLPLIVSVKLDEIATVALKKIILTALKSVKSHIKLHDNIRQDPRKPSVPESDLLPLLYLPKGFRFPAKAAIGSQIANVRIGR